MAHPKKLQWTWLYEKAGVPFDVSHIEKLPPESQLMILSIAGVQAQFFEHHGCISDEECWLWEGAFGTYGTFQVGRLRMAAHRASWVMANKKVIPKGNVICHKCDIRSCVNPNHLFAGTQAENMQDMLAKGRNRRGRKSHITPTEVIEIRNSAESIKEIGSRLGIEYGVVYAARYGYSWSRLRDPAPWPRPIRTW